jgi:arylformamidase
MKVSVVTCGCKYSDVLPGKSPDIVDITVPLQSDMPVWPGCTGVRVTPIMRLEKGDSANISQLECNLHTGTHVDAPKHFLQSGTSVEQLPLDVLVGPSFVAHLPEALDITPGDLADLNLPPGIRRLLLRTRNSELWAAETAEFREDYAALTPEAAQWIVDQKIRLIGMDYLSVQRFADSSITHEILLGAGTVVLEGLNLSNVQPGFYELVCLPLKLLDAEAAPARAILRSIAEADEKPSRAGVRL